MTASTSTPEQLRINSLEQEVHYLKEQLAWFQRQVFGQKSEKVIEQSSQLYLDGLGELSQETSEEKQKIAGHARTKQRKGQDKISFPEDLPVESQVIDLPETEKICTVTNQALVKIGEEITRKIVYKPGSYYLKKIVRLKYALPQGEGIRTAPLPETLLNRCQADESLLADIIVKKFADHLPLCRQSEILARQGIGISRQIMSEWVMRCGKALKPLFDEMTKHVLQSGNVFADETPIDMLAPGNGKTEQGYMWVLVGGQASNPPYRVYNFRNGREHSHAADLLKGYTGVLHSDKYGAYEALANKKQFVWCPCWAHIRRKFIEAESGDPPLRKEVLELIKDLFLLEEVAWSHLPEERLLIRQEKQVPIIDRLIELIKGRLIQGDVLPKSKFKEALGYFCSLIPHLKNYTQHPFARLDNNVAERAVRPLAIGRKNWLFVGSEIGGEAAATLLSLVQSCRALNINPWEYLVDVMRRMMSHPANKLFELLSDQWAKEKNII